MTICVKEFLQEVTPNATDAKLLLMDCYNYTARSYSYTPCTAVQEYSNSSLKNVQALTEKGMQKEMQYPAVLKWRASAQKKTNTMAEKLLQFTLLF